MKKATQLFRFTHKLFSEFISKWKHFGFMFAWYNLVWWLCFYIRPPFCWKLSYWAMRNKTVWLDRYISNKYAKLLEKFQKDESKHSYPCDKYTIWVFWGQGKSQMPPLIQACYRQLTTYNENVVLITNDNVKEYIELSDIIYSKVKDGRITWAHFSDIVRTTLLAKYGGLWLDATVWVSGQIPFEALKQMPIYSANGKVPVNSKSICFWTSFEWNWSTWCMYSHNKQYPLFKFVSEMLQCIAEKEKCWPDYVIQDYLIYYACRSFPTVRDDMELCQRHESKYRNYLANLMNDPFDEIVYKDLIKSNFAFKLSFRSLWKERTSDGKQTFYGRILEDCI